MASVRVRLIQSARPLLLYHILAGGLILDKIQRQHLVSAGPTHVTPNKVGRKESFIDSAMDTLAQARMQTARDLAVSPSEEVKRTATAGCWFVKLTENVAGFPLHM